MKHFKIWLTYEGRILKGTMEAESVALCILQLNEWFPGHTSRTLVIL